MASFQIPRLHNWNDFELLCCDILKRLWADPGTKRYGRSGQNQSGIDIIGRPNNGDKWYAGQCKSVNHEFGKKLTVRKIDTAVERAKAIYPVLSHLIILTAAEKDTRLEDHCRKITARHLKEKLFSVDIWAWEEIESSLKEHSDIYNKHYSEYQSLTQQIDSKSDDLSLDVGVTVEISGIQANYTPSQNQTVSSIADITLNTEYDAELNTAKRLINEFKPSEAVIYLEELKVRIWHKANNQIKFRLITNLGAAKLSLNHSDAPNLFIEAFQYGEDSEKALTNIALAYQILGNKTEAESYAKQALKKNPANEDAYTTLIAVAESHLDYPAIELIVPEEFRSLPSVLYSLAQILRNDGNLDQAEIKLREALKKNRDAHPDLIAELGSIIIARVARAYEENPLLQEANPNNAESLQEAIALIDKAVEKIPDARMKVLRSAWFGNRGIAYKLLGDNQSAIRDLDHALSLDGNNPEILKHRGLLSLVVNDSSNAKRYLERSVALNQTQDTCLILAQVYAQDGDFSKAISLVENVLHSNTDNTKFIIEAKRLLAEFYIHLRDLPKAKEITDALRSDNPTDVLALIDASKIASLSGNNSDAMTLAQEAAKNLTPKSTTREILAIADQLYTLGQYSDAIIYYEQTQVPPSDNPIIRRLLSCYYNAGQNDKALQVCENLSSQGHHLKFVCEIQSMLFDQIGDLESAKNSCSAYLKNDPLDFDIRARLTIIEYRSNHFEEVDIFLNWAEKQVDLTLQQKLLLAKLARKRNRYELALKILYEARRSNYDDSDIHLRYINLFFSTPDSQRPLPDVNQVMPNTAFCIETTPGDKKWYVIEEQFKADYSKNEIDIENKLSQEALGKSVGEKIIIRKNIFQQEEQAIICEIKSKYVHALHESLKNFELLFSDSDSFSSVTIDPNDEKRFEPIKKSLIKRERHCRMVEDFYKQGKLTIGGFAKLIGANVIGMFLGLMENPQLGVKSSSNKLEELQKSEESLRLPNRKLVLDITAIMTLHDFGIQQDVLEFLPPLFIAQSTIDLINEFIEETKIHSPNGYMSIGHSQGVFYKQEITKEDIDKKQAYLSSLSGWVTKYCTKQPVLEALKVNKKKKEELVDFIGESFLDSILIAKNSDFIFYSEDERLRSFAGYEFGVNSAWTCVILDFLFENKKIDRKNLHEFKLELIRKNFYYLSINPEILIEAAAQSNWIVDEKLSKILRCLSGESCSQKSALIVAVNFFFELWKAPILPQQRDNIILNVINNLVLNRNREDVIKALLIYTEKRFEIIPLEQNRMMKLILIWKELNLV